MTQPRIGFAGLGHMGAPMAARVAAHGFPLTVWNRTAGRTGPLTAQGASAAATLRELAAGSDVVITMLSDGAAAAEVWTGPGGLLESCGPGTIGIDMSTIGPRAARDIAARAERAGVRFLDAPVSGSVALAEQGKLTAMVGGEDGALAGALPVLRTMTARQLHLGPPGAGAAMKLAVNIMIAATNQAVAESLALAAETGIDLAGAYEVLTVSAVASPFLQYKRDAYLAADDAPVSFSTSLMSKDLRLALDIADQAGLPLTLTAAARESLERACAAGLGDADFASVARLLRRAEFYRLRRAAPGGDSHQNDH
ncbi:MAG: NAD(P)-dependent oxidoreductase [Trebonia sp.]